ncbi:30S ribosomal protein S8 [Candidatus Microgenomates bacterium]|nr:30S ribosomal protein S8 [Candidatus Microgenomates bacterium]
MDTIANMLTQIRNAQMAGLKTCVVRFSKINEALIGILKNEGYLSDYKIEEIEGRKSISTILAYHEKNSPAIRGLDRVSKPGRRIYSSSDKLPYVLNGLGMAIISTSRGLMTDKVARKEKIGGEIICKVW